MSAQEEKLTVIVSFQTKGALIGLICQQDLWAIEKSTTQNPQSSIRLVLLLFLIHNFVFITAMSPIPLHADDIYMVHGKL